MSNSVSATAYYCAGTRMLDALRTDTLLNDSFAARFMGADGLSIFEKFRHLAIPIGAHQVRCYLIDQAVRARLKANPETLVVLVGAGFDSRAFRIPGGRWIEIDERPIIERKNAVAPVASCSNPLERIAVSFHDERLRDVLVPFATDAPVLVICEGVSMYLEAAEIDEFAAALATAFPHHWLYVDLMNRGFARAFAKGMSRVLASIGTAFSSLEADPLGHFRRLGYSVEATHPLMPLAIAMRRVPLPALLAPLFRAIPIFRNGYQLAMLTKA
jgi:O-methyltransferase involved in polyketide biosynthesis